MNLSKPSNALRLNSIPTWGVLIFLLLYIYAASLYPGGSQADLNSSGFDWLNNYWCNLMNKKGGNGINNSGRPFAILAMLLLCGSLIVFFFQFANHLVAKGFWQNLIKVGGTISMLFAMLIFTSQHDLMTILASIFGLFAVIGIIKTIYQTELKGYKLFGLVCLLLLGLNNYIYYSSQYLAWLPLLQKITLALVLLWILGLNTVIRKRINAANYSPNIHNK